MAGSAPTQRQLRVGEHVRHALTGLLQRGEIADPDLDGVVVSVNEVRMSPDLRIATAYVTALGRDDQQPIVKALARNARFIRGRLSPELGQMKFMPEFRFRADTSFDNFDRVDALLRSPAVARDLDDDE
ncbi:30S ribosome-binding factor RbfA [Roseitalea porphyridii]|uniref:Ribosome-binding factor A n=1 Tax=Roseitalea porphyridii TaxID=1852022 RepID=A0A4P6V054_9HYPH|nr:30S ribosome-binding factor RbfA [Roseitalea porphyridii]QBK29680.1 30S ribosome-binding factor RbfA [Roseitalea porphyridii]